MRLLFGGWQIWISKEIWHQCLKTNIFPIASILVFFFLEFVQLQQRQLLLLLCQSRLELVRLQLVLKYHTVFDRGRSERTHPYYWNLPRSWNSWFHRRNIPEDIARWEKGLDQILIKVRFFLCRGRLLQWLFHDERCTPKTPLPQEQPPHAKLLYKIPI